MTDNCGKLRFAVGAVGAAIAGVALPAFSLVFGQLVDAIGKVGLGTGSLNDVRFWALIFIALGAAAWLAAWAEVRLSLFR